MNHSLECWTCKKSIKNNDVVYMCVDCPFCSIQCRESHYTYIKQIDPNLNSPYKWNKPTNKNTSINCFIEIDYLKISNFNRLQLKHKGLNKSRSLYDMSLSEITDNDNEKSVMIKKEKMIITCIKFYKFHIKLSSTKIKILSIIIFIIFLSILIKQLNI